MKKISRYLIYIGIFAAPFSTLRVPNVNLTISDLILILAGFSLLVLSRDREISNEINSNSTKIWYIWTIGTGLIIIGFLISEMFVVESTYKIIVESFQYAFIFVYIPFLLSKLDYNECINAARAYIFGLLAVIIIGAILWFFFKPLYAQLSEAGIVSGYLRFGSFLGANGLPKTIAATMPLLFILFFYKRINIYSVGAAFAILLVGTIMAASWGGTISVLLSTVMLIAVSLLFKPVVTTKVVVSLLFMFLVMLVIFNYLGLYEWSETFSYRITDPFKTGELLTFGSYELKQNQMGEALEIISESPFVGVGAGNYWMHSMYAIPVHNSYLLIWAEGGLLGAVGFMLILISSLLYSIGYWRRNSRSIQGILVAIIIVVLSISAITNTEAYPRYTWLPLIISLCILITKDGKVEQCSSVGT